MRHVTVLAVCVAFGPVAYTGQAVCRVDHAVVSYEGIGEPYARAIARTIASARAVAVDEFSFDMPDTITVNVTPGEVQLFTDGRDRVFLSVQSEEDLRKPSVSGTFHLYGLCHEVGHVAMYRLIRDHSWMTTAGAEGWAHYFGSRAVDSVHAREGGDLWPDRYNYLADGTRRLKRQFRAARSTPTVRGARTWAELVKIVNSKGIAPVFRAWGEARVDAADPAAALRKPLLQAHPDAPLAGWWTRAESVLVLKRPKSDLAAHAVRAADLSGRPVEQARDDGTPAGRQSMAGGGHAVRFDAPGEGWYLTAVRGPRHRRYGQPVPPQEDFHVWLCDRDFKAIADFAFPYAKFQRGQAKWVTLTVTPTEVPSSFIVCAGFNPTATKGVFVSRDAQAGEHSLSGLPGRPGAAVRQGDWLIRVTVDRLKSADSLRPGR